MRCITNWIFRRRDVHTEYYAISSTRSILNPIIAKPNVVIVVYVMIVLTFEWSKLSCMS